MRTRVPKYVRLSPLEAGRVEWATEGSQFEDGGPGEGALRAFLALATLPDSAVPSFIHRWGPLGVCRHRAPFTHDAACIPVPAIEAGLAVSHADPDGRGPRDPELRWVAEQVGDWRAIAREMQAALDTACQLVHGFVPPEAKLPVWRGDDSERRHRYSADSTDGRRVEARAQLDGALQEWRRMARIEPVLAWADAGERRWRWAAVPLPAVVGTHGVPAPNLYGLLVRELLDAVTRDLVECPACGNATWAEPGAGTVCTLPGCGGQRSAAAA